MAALVPAKCTECGGNININPNERLSICEYCGKPFVVQEAIQNFNTTYNITTNISNEIKADVINVYDSSSNAENLLVRARNFLDTIQFDRALEYCDRVLDIDPGNETAKAIIDDVEKYSIMRKAKKKLKLSDKAWLATSKVRGHVIIPDDLEDPSVCAELVDCGVLRMPENTLCVKDVIGQMLRDDTDSLSPITEEMIYDDSDAEADSFMVLDDSRLNLNDKAVTKRSIKAGEIIQTSDLEDPAIFTDLIKAWLLEITDETLCVREVIGREIKTSVDSLTPLSTDMFE